MMEANDQVNLVADKAIRTFNELVELINSQQAPLTQNLGVTSEYPAISKRRRAWQIRNW